MNLKYNRLKDKNIQHHCPRCGSKKIMDYGNTFDCKICNLEFEKGDFEILEDEEDILAISEKLAFTQHLNKFE